MTANLNMIILCLSYWFVELFELTMCLNCVMSITISAINDDYG